MFVFLIQMPHNANDSSSCSSDGSDVEAWLKGTEKDLDNDVGEEDQKISGEGEGAREKVAPKKSSASSSSSSPSPAKSGKRGKAGAGEAEKLEDPVQKLARSGKGSNVKESKEAASEAREKDGAIPTLIGPAGETVREVRAGKEKKRGKQGSVKPAKGKGAGEKKPDSKAKKLAEARARKAVDRLNQKERDLTRRYFTALLGGESEEEV